MRIYCFLMVSELIEEKDTSTICLANNQLLPNSNTFQLDYDTKSTNRNLTMN